MALPISLYFHMIRIFLHLLPQNFSLSPFSRFVGLQGRVFKATGCFMQCPIKLQLFNPSVAEPADPLIQPFAIHILKGVFAGGT